MTDRGEAVANNLPLMPRNQDPALGPIQAVDFIIILRPRHLMNDMPRLIRSIHVTLGRKKKKEEDKCNDNKIVIPNPIINPFTRLTRIPSNNRMPRKK